MPWVTHPERDYCRLVADDDLPEAPQIPPELLSATDQLEALTTQHARQIVRYYQTLVEGHVPTEMALTLTEDLAVRLNTMAIPQKKPSKKSRA